MNACILNTEKCNDNKLPQSPIFAHYILTSSFYDVDRNYTTVRKKTLRNYDRDVILNILQNTEYGKYKNSTLIISS